MSPPLALVLTVLLIGYLLRRDVKAEPKPSPAVWIPTIWLMINGSRQVSQWLGADLSLASRRLEEGSTTDKAVYSVLIIAGLCVLFTRRIRFGEVLSNNFAIVLFILYEGLSVVWSEYPLIASRRWIKSLGDPVMILILWSDPFPSRAIAATIKRCAYVLIPLSVLFCKYYENLGRTFSAWGGSSYTGVTTDKNMLGYLLFAFGLFFTAAFAVNPGPIRITSKRDRIDQMVNLLLLFMIVWLARIANSQTAALALVAGIAVLVATRIRTVRRHFWTYAAIAIALGVVSETLFSLSSNLLEAAGRDVTFTGRTGLWETLLREPINPLVGVGYASFWLGDRLAKYWAMYPTSPPIEAHDGYLEVYLNLGVIGVCLIVFVLWTGLSRMRQRLARSDDGSQTADDRVLATFGVAYGLAYVLYNITEATFQGSNTLFVIFLILSFTYSHSAAPQFGVPHFKAGGRQRIARRRCGPRVQVLR
jgi:exopolysaccharide production protein ExoQ